MNFPVSIFKVKQGDLIVLVVDLSHKVDSSNKSFKKIWVKDLIISLAD